MIYREINTSYIVNIEVLRDNCCENNAIHIAFGIDKNYACPLGVMITSILEHNSNVFFHVFADDLYPEDVHKLKQTMEKFDCAGIWYQVKPSLFEEFPTTLGWSKAMYFRFVAVQSLYGKIKRLLYLDADMLCVNELNTLYNIDMEGKAVAGVRDKGLPEGRLERIGHKGDGYFNSGMLLFDVEEWKKMDLFSRAIDMLKNEPNRFEAYDQDVLNLLYQDNVFWLPIKYNQDNNESDVYPTDTAIIHYTSTPKPWFAWYYTDGPNLYAQQKARSCWKDVPIITQPRNTREYRLMARTMWKNAFYVESLNWYVLYLMKKIRN